MCSICIRCMLKVLTPKVHLVSLWGLINRSSKVVGILGLSSPQEARAIKLCPSIEWGSFSHYEEFGVLREFVVFEMIDACFGAGIDLGLVAIWGAYGSLFWKLGRLCWFHWVFEGRLLMAASLACYHSFWQWTPCFFISEKRLKLPWLWLVTSIRSVHLREEGVAQVLQQGHSIMLGLPSERISSSSSFGT